MKLYKILLILSVIFLYACSSSTQDGVTQSGDKKEVQVISSCDDANSCTEDFYNSLTNACEHKTLPDCCGDSICTDNERVCDTITHKTSCDLDCVKDCPAYLSSGDFSCEGSCTQTGVNEFTITGAAKFNNQISNLGEKGSEVIQGGFNCVTEKGDVFINKPGMIANGMEMFNYFENDVKMKQLSYLSGVQFARNLGKYTLEIKGVPLKDVNVNCEVRFSSSDYYDLKNLKFKIDAV